MRADAAGAGVPQRHPRRPSRRPGHRQQDRVDLQRQPRRRAGPGTRPATGGARGPHLRAGQRGGARGGDRPDRDRRLGAGGRMTVRLVAAAVAPVWRASTGSERDDRVTEALAGEPVVTTGAERDGRVEVVVPWQPSSLRRRGLPGMGRDGAPGARGRADPASPPAGGHLPARDRRPRRAGPHAARHAVRLGRAERRGIDCSGLVHLVHRSLGSVVPRDARDQAAALPASTWTRYVVGTSTSSPGRAGPSTMSPSWSSRASCCTPRTVTAGWSRPRSRPRDAPSSLVTAGRVGGVLR